MPGAVLTGRACRFCGESLAGRRSDALFCSASCRSVHSRVRRIMEGKRPDGYTSILQYISLRRGAGRGSSMPPSPDVWPIVRESFQATKGRVARSLRMLSDEGFASCDLSQWSEDDLRCRWCDSLTPPDERFCSAGCEIEAIEQHLMWAARPAAVRAANGLCLDCGAPSREVHHIRPARGGYLRPGCIHHATNLRPLCRACHRLAHVRLRAKDPVS